MIEGEHNPCFVNSLGLRLEHLGEKLDLPWTKVGNGSFAELVLRPLEGALQIDGQHHSNADNAHDSSVDDDVALEAQVVHGVPTRFGQDVFIPAHETRCVHPYTHMFITAHTT